MCSPHISGALLSGYTKQLRLSYRYYNTYFNICQTINFYSLYQVIEDLPNDILHKVIDVVYFEIEEIQ